MFAVVCVCGSVGGGVCGVSVVLVASGVVVASVGIDVVDGELLVLSRLFMLVLMVVL